VSETAPPVAAPPAQPAVRLIKTILALAIAILPLLWALDAYRQGAFALQWLGVIGQAQDMLFQPEQLLAFVLGLGLALVYLHYPARRNTERGRVPWYDMVAAAVGLVTGLYIAYAYPRLSETLYLVPTDGVIAAAILYLLAIEGLRRAVGYSLVVVVLLFSVYALVGHLVPGAFETRKVALDRLVLYLGVDNSAMFGIVMLVAVTVVVPFIFFGQLLLYSGGSSFFNDFSLAAMGRYRGGSAKISVTASSLFGSISGIVVSNILATGIVTIPLMKKAGFPPRFAAAVEATASTGGQLMPPVMGAVAFLMANFLQMSYGEVMVAAIVPSLLYYVALFIQADLEAAKLGITRVAESEIPRMRSVAGGLIFFVPFAALIVALFTFNLEAAPAAMWAAGSTRRSRRRANRQSIS
jgi:TRAP transporter 4TM/12TM fusion protein